ncbi:MAG: acyl-CoA carboxylase subunit beta [Deltaproteobacteria bacterium]|nr:acyl-CoA carboxylase subunit beta [Deltaproteobacteria bacterium]
MSTTKELLERTEKAKLGGGPDKIKKQHASGKLTARERIDLLVDESTFDEMGMFVTHQSNRMGSDTKYYGDGVVAGSGKIDGRLVFLYAQDFTVLGGSLGEAHAKKICQVQDMAVKVGAPIIGIIDSGGARIQEGLGHYGGIFFRNVVAAGVVPQLSIIVGPCAGGGVYSPALTDFIFMVDGISRMHITGPAVIRAVTGEEITAEKLGGAKVHATCSGVAHIVSATEQDCFAAVKDLLGYLPSNCNERPHRKPTKDPVDRLDEGLETLVPPNPKKAYNMRLAVEAVMDDNKFLEIQNDFARNIIIGFGRLNGCSVGVIANQPLVYAGCLDINSSVKAARFIRFCDAFQIPIVNFVDCPGYLPGSNQEFGGIIRHGAKMLYAYSEATVPRISIVFRKIYGGALSGMAVSKYVGTDLTAVLPTAEIAIMGPEAAVNVLYKKEIAESADPATTRLKLTEQYRRDFANPYVAAEDGWVDAVIEPRKIRPFLITALDRLKDKKELRPAKRHGTIPL